MAAHSPLIGVSPVPVPAPPSDQVDQAHVAEVASTEVAPLDAAAAQGMNVVSTLTEILGVAEVAFGLTATGLLLTAMWLAAPRWSCRRSAVWHP